MPSPQTRDRKETGNWEQRMQGNDASCHSGRSLVLLTLAVLEGDDFWKEVDVRASFFFIYFLFFVSLMCMCVKCLYVYTDMHRYAREGQRKTSLSSLIALHLTVLSQDLSPNLKLTMSVWLAGQETPRVCLSAPQCWSHRCAWSL